MKHSSFDLNEQNQSIESRIIVALERVSEAFRVLLWSESKENSLSPIQIQILIFLQFHPNEMCTVGNLAKEFNMTKATISDSVKMLLSKKLIGKETNPNDTRSFTIYVTEVGHKIVEKSSLFANSLKKPINTLSIEQKNAMLNGLLTLIYDLNKAGVITIQRMCFTCANYRLHKSEHYCTLLNMMLETDELRIDCSDHSLIKS